MGIDSNYLAWQNALISWAEAATGLSADWINERQKQQTLPAYVTLDGPNSIEEVGPDYLTYDMSTPNSALPLPTGVRTLTVTVKVTSRSQKAIEKAGVYLERARMALVLPATQDAFNAAGISVADRSMIRLQDGTGNNDRVESRAAFVLTLNAVPDALTGGLDLGVVRQVAVTSTGFTPNLVAENMPPGTPPI